MKIIIVMGPPCVGKSTFIKNNFKDVEVVDLIDFQKDYMSIDEIWKSYEDCAKELQKHIINNKDVVLEHTLLKAIRRKYYLDEIRKITNNPVEIYCLTATPEILEKHYNNRVKDNHTNSWYFKEAINTLEIPNKNEGFDEVHIIKIEK